MDVIIDGKGGFDVKGEPETVFAVLVAVTDYLRANGRAMMAIKADGRDISPAALSERVGDKPISAVTTLEVTSAEVAVLVQDALAELENAVAELPHVCRNLAQVFQSAAPHDGFEPFHKLAGIWGHIKSQELMVFNALDLPDADVRLDGESIAQLHEDLNGYLEEAVGALKAQDTVLLGDLLEYELAPRAERESRIVALLKDKAHQRAG
jgi:hypothetical protein